MKPSRSPVFEGDGMPVGTALGDSQPLWDRELESERARERSAASTASMAVGRPSMTPSPLLARRQLRTPTRPSEVT